MNKKTKKENKLLHTITLYTKNILVELANVILYKLDNNNKIWLPKNKLWLNEIKKEEFTLPFFNYDDYDFSVLTAKKECNKCDNNDVCRCENIWKENKLGIHEVWYLMTDIGLESKDYE